jgi:hypothetical protein
LVAAVALGVRLLPVLLADRETADVARYRRVAQHVLDVSWNPYQAPRLYPYPPVWMWVEAGSEWVARRTALPFAVLVKLPVVAADLGLVMLLARLGARRGLGLAAAWLYAAHPVSVLVTGFHGQFDALALLLVLLALAGWDGARRDASALALAAAIAVKSFPVLLLPFFLARTGSPRAALRFGALATAPVALMLVPFALADPGALRRELFAYGGVADFGWIALARGIRWLAGGGLLRSDARAWGALVPLSKVLFFATWGALLAAFWRGRLRWDLREACLAVLVAFPTLYGLVSAQYLLWPVPLAALAPDRHGLRWSLAATTGLLGFYAFLHPAVLAGDSGWLVRVARPAGALWVAGVAALLATGLAWLAALVRRARAS